MWSLHVSACVIGIFAPSTTCGVKVHVELSEKIAQPTSDSNGSSPMKVEGDKGNANLVAEAHSVNGATGNITKTKSTEQQREEKTKLKINESGSPTNEDMKKIDDVVKKGSSAAREIHSWPVNFRFCVAALILAVPCLITCLFILCISSERLASSVLVRTSLHCSFSFITGWLNCIMLLRYGVFATMMVGNTMLMGVSFVCNGGFSRPKSDENEIHEWWDLQESVPKSCPAQFDFAGHYLIIIILFLLGSFIHGYLHTRWGWSSRPFAPIVLLGIIVVEMVEYFQVLSDSRVDVYILSPIFGMFVSISTHGKIGSVPWADSGHMVSFGFSLAKFFVKLKGADLQLVVVNTFLWGVFFLGVMTGTLFHSNRDVGLNAIALQTLILVHAFVYDYKARGSPDESNLLVGSAEGHIAEG